MLTAFLIAVIIGVIFIAVIAVSMVKAETEKQKKNKPVLDGQKRGREGNDKEIDENEKFRREAIGEEAYQEEKKTDRQFDLLNKAGELEAQGRVDEAIEIYEGLIARGIKNPGPHSRLAIIYRKRKLYDDEIRVIQKHMRLIINKVISQEKELKREEEKNQALPANDPGREYEIFLRGLNARYKETYLREMDKCKQRIVKVLALKSKAARQE